MLGQVAGAALCIAASGAVAEPAGARPDVPTVTGISHIERADGPDLVFDFVPAPHFAVFTLTAPDRLVVDLPALRWRVEDVPEIPFVSALRHSLVRPDRARVVVGLRQPLGIERAFAEAPRGDGPGRLVIELARVTRAEFDARAGAPEGARWQGGRMSAVPTGRPGEVPGKAPGDLVVALDPGHGGIDPGARVGRLVEKTLVLDFARRLAAEFDERPGFRAVLTRGTTSSCRWPSASTARMPRARLMISVHADVLEQGRARGVSAYTLSEKGTDEAADALAARENRSDVLAGADLAGETDQLTRLPVELAQRGTRHESAKLARSGLDAVAENSDVLGVRPHRQAGFRVLQAPDMPSILLEPGFMDDPEDGRRLGDPDWLARTAGAVADGAAEWRSADSPGFVAPR